MPVEIITFDDNDLKPREIQVKLAGEDYILREASADVAKRYRNASFKAISMRNQTMTLGMAIGDLEIMLIKECLLKAIVKDGQTIYSPVTEGFVANLPNRVVKPLFERAKRMSDLDERGDDPDPELIGLCRKDLAAQYHPDKGGGKEDEQRMQGVNAALDWLKDHQRKNNEELAKNGSWSGGSISE